MSGSGISWAVCKSASRSRQITMPAPHHSVFLQAGCPSCRPTNSVKALKAHGSDKSLYYSLRIIVNDLELLDGLYCLTTGVAVNVKLMMIVAVHEMCKKESL